MTKRLNTLIDHLIYHKDKENLDTYWKARFFIISMTVFGVMALFYMPFYFSPSEQKQLPYANIAMILSWVSLLSVFIVYPRFGFRNLIVMAFIVTSGIPSWVAVYYGGGGIYSPDMTTSLAMIPLIFLISNWIVGLIAAAISIGTYVFYYYADVSGLHDSRAEFEYLSTDYYLMSAVFGFIFVAAILFLHELNKRKFLGEIYKSKAIIAEKNAEILDSIHYAKRIQNAILPPEDLFKKSLKNSFVLYKPKDIVAGDFYWMEPTSDKTLFAAADCTGHGVPGAMVSVICNNGLNRAVREYGLNDPGQILDKTREIVIQEFEKSKEEVKDGMDIALCSLSGQTLKYAGAHNPLWIIRKGAVEVEEIKANKQPIGKFDIPTPFATHTIELSAGDTIYIFSDGYADQFGGEKGKKFKAAALKKLLLSIQNESMERQQELLDQMFENWRGEIEQLDDVCIIGVRV